MGYQYQEANYLWRGGLKMRQELKVDEAKRLVKHRQKLIKSADNASINDIRINKQQPKVKKKIEALQRSVQAAAANLEQEVK